MARGQTRSTAGIAISSLCWCASLALAGCAPRSDPQQACDVARALLADNPRSFEGGTHEWWEGRWAAWGEGIMAATPAFHEALSVGGCASPYDLPEIVRAVAGEVGEPDWTCPELEQIFVPPERELAYLCGLVRSFPEQDEPGTEQERRELRELFELPEDLSAYEPRAEAVRVAWARMLSAPPSARVEVLRQASEWPERALQDCPGLAQALGELSP